MALRRVHHAENDRVRHLTSDAGPGKAISDAESARRETFRSEDPVRPPRRRLHDRQPDLHRPARARRRQAGGPDEAGRLGARAHPRARARKADEPQYRQAAPDAQSLYEGRRRQVQPFEMARSRGRQGEADHGGLSRPAGGNRLPVLPPRHADHLPSGRLALCLRPDPQRMDVHDAAVDRDVRRLCRLQGTGDLCRQRDLEAPVQHEARLSGRARPAADLRRIRHVDRAELPPRQHGNRRALDPARRGIHADHGRAVLSAGPSHGL